MEPARTVSDAARRGADGGGPGPTVNPEIAAYLDAFGALLQDLDLAAVDRVADVLAAAREKGATVYVAGNGGSAATATHWVNDLGKATKTESRPPMRVMCLSDNTPWLTALANDEGYDRVFAGQLENFATPGDVLIVLSASGSSPNLVKAVESAQRHGVTSVGLLGFDGGALRSMVDVAVWVRSPMGAYGPVETMHALVADIVTTCLARMVG